MPMQKVDYDEAVQLFYEGMSLRWLAKKYQVHLITIRDGLRRREIDTARYAICHACGRRLSGSDAPCSVCETIVLQKKIFQDKQKEEGLCRCGAPAEVSRRDRPSCMPCWFACAGQSIRGNGTMLQQIFEEQQRCCAYSGELLIPGVNMSLDHKLPRSRGGTNNTTNLQCVTRRVNLMKADMTHEEFLALCRAIANATSKETD